MMITEFQGDLKIKCEFVRKSLCFSGFSQDFRDTWQVWDNYSSNGCQSNMPQMDTIPVPTGKAQAQ